MSLDDAQFISELSVTDPPFNDPVGEADDHIRTTKRATQQSFPNVDKEVSTTADELNFVAGVTSSIQTQLDLISANIIEGGSKALFFNATAPTGWTIDAAFNDRALKIVSSGGGGLAGVHAFSSIFQSAAWPTTAVGNHSHGGSTSAAVSSFGGFGLSNNGNSVAHNHTISADGAHSHSSDLRVQYAVGTVCTKDAF